MNNPVWLFALRHHGAAPSGDIVLARVLEGSHWHATPVVPVTSDEATQAALTPWQDPKTLYLFAAYEVPLPRLLPLFILPK